MINRFPAFSKDCANFVHDSTNTEERPIITHKTAFHAPQDPTISSERVVRLRVLVPWAKFEITTLYTGVSKASLELMAFCEAHAKDDPLVTPVPTSENPYREKKLFCSIL
uniref:Guanine nucleotide-binding protein subunit gamma n=1 Tax=Eptatretus burgeri TaxID=7764 RepID=A0A8C4R4V2_EPTBU